MQLEGLNAGMQGWRLNDMHAHVGGQSWKATGMSDHGLQGGEHFEEQRWQLGKLGLGWVSGWRWRMWREAQM